MVVRRLVQPTWWMVWKWKVIAGVVVAATLVAGGSAAYMFTYYP